MASKPSSLPEWATTGGTTLEPSAGEKASGWEAGYKPPARKMNWLQNLAYQWIQYLADAVFVADASSGDEGVDATGDGAAAGVKGTGGSTGAGGEFTGNALANGVTATGGDAGGVGIRGNGGGDTGVGVRGYGGAVSGYGGIFNGSGGSAGATGASTNGIGLHGNSTNNIGVHGESENSYGVVAQGDTSNPAVSAFRIVPQNPAPTGPNQVGDIYVTTAGVPYICTSAGTPGTWTKISAT